MNRTAEMRAIVRRWEASGLSMKAFAEDEDIAYSTFLYWRRRLDEEEADLVPVSVVADAAADDGRHIEIRTPEGLVVKVPRDLEEDHFRRVVGVLSGC